MLSRWLRAPLTHFLLIGLALFLFQELRSEEIPPLVISRERLGQLAAEWSSHSGAAPNAEEAEQLVEQAIEDELLMEVALDHGLHREDPQVRRRLVRLGRFVSGAPEAADADENELFEQALELGLHRRDALARQRLTDGARFLLTEEDPQPRPSDEELREYLQQERETFELPPRARVTQLLFPAENRRQAAEVLGRLQSDGIGPHAAELSEEGPWAPPPPPRRPGPLSREDLQRRFGDAFAELAFSAETGSWAGPVSSPWGEHLLWVEERLPASLPEVDGNREVLTESWILHRRRTRLADALEELRTQREIVVQRPPGFGTGGPGAASSDGEEGPS
ncbi:MAG: peptidylprolyl isomerase [Acidobacteriota bacterium]|nr:peptidylprolyl isomerase [Acidobacteriota bacterium]